MIAPAPLAALIAATRIDATRAAIVARLAALLPGVAVVGHPGKLDINDVVAKAVVAAPGIAIGYSRVRQLRDIGGTFGLAVDWVAYLVVDDWVDRSGAQPRSVPREIVAHAIGTRLLLILADPDTSAWGLGAIDVPAAEPPPELKPVFTVKTADQATGLYAVTWTQSLVQEGRSFFGFGPNPVSATVYDAATGTSPLVDELDFDLPEGDIPAELLPYLKGGTPFGDGSS